MKQLTKNLLKINFKGINLDDVSTVEFAFSQNVGEAPLKVATYPSVNAVKLSNTSIGVVWNTDDTLLFKAGEYFYADTRITLNESEYQPETPIAKLKMNPTLFEGA